MNKITTFLMIIITALAFTLGTTMQSKAQSRSFSGVIPFITSNDRVGFFNQSNGQIYIYDSDVSKCLFIGQMQNLGDPIQTLTSTATSTTNQ